MTETAGETVRLSLDALRALAVQVLERHGCSAAMAGAVADNMTAAERDGAASHGVFRLKGHVDLLKGGVVNGRAEPVLSRPAPGAVRVDAGLGFAPLALALGLPALAEAAREQGVAALTLTRTVHFAALWPEVEALADQGLVALAFTSSPPNVVPAGGRVPVFGTNPMAFAWPRPDGPPLVWDQASAAMARGEIMLHARDGHTLPEGAGIDAEGRPTTDPKAVLDGGAQLAFGGYKGALVALMVDLLAGPLFGEVTSLECGAAATMGGPQPGGELILALDPVRLGGRSDGAEALLAAIAGQEGARLPGQRRFANRARSLAEGVDLPSVLHAEIEALAAG
ncbi:bifunctional delta(1)-pyrroline-2-carboxylate/delta(1)-piperideine-2-car boxylate reductase [Paralimibaculum aggregatum]|uniref:Bifunctional delta(1)-pyrroline-2-carboxylate/delta(1)-piperideine-2-car boxylate reductase n=1 Tax=Paralimibaculum aggregatum TaxID=3036245 RepID=A0ABQ6LQW3_9RHOB|nr:Ldh family oxidoreductase [Limibaculum sp. NKW23]GMG84103.1 bifunctional delta(1)-pyrroline-2-carboxylate/delta(1)-piperideine-2-car boxylate reductase [Limibaculum sp. NKW23]